MLRRGADPRNGLAGMEYPARSALPRSGVKTRFTLTCDPRRRSRTGTGLAGRVGYGMELGDRLVAERRARLAAERLLELKSRELFAANRKLAEHARELSEEIVVQRRVVETAQTVNEALKGENVRVRTDLQRATQARTVAEHRLWLALETIRDGFAIYDATTRLVVANNAYLSVFDGLEEVGPGAQARDILRIGIEEGVFDPGEETAADWIEGLLARWRCDTIEPRVIRLWNGRYIKLVDRRGGDGGIVSLALDITDTMRRETELRSARLKAESANRAKSAFLATMSHELRTPMNGVVGMADLLSDTALSEEQRLYVETIRSSGEALLLIINDVLDFSKLEAERLDILAEPFDLERLVHEVAVMLSPAAAKKGLTLAVDFDLALPAAVVGDRGRLRQVLTNLAGNAVKFTETGHVLIRVGGQDAGQQGADGRARLCIAVEDTGIGIPPEMVEHIFGEFTQIENARNRKFDGTGLGLAISRRLVRRMGGDITVDSAPGAGSRFAFTIGLAAAPGVPRPRPPTLPPGLGGLVVDADPLTRAILAGQLAALGLRVRDAERMPAAAELAGAPVDLVFLDAAAAAAPLPPALSRAGAVLVAEAGAAPVEDGRFAAPLARPALREQLFSALAAAVLQRAPERAEPAPAEGVLRILAAEDNRTNQLVLGRMLKDLPLEITFAGNGREALEIYPALRPDLVFMDISMPEMDGKEATRRIRALERREGLRHTPIVALTAHALEGDAQEFIAAGLDHCLTKPIRKALIVEALERFLPGRLPAGAPAEIAEAAVPTEATGATGATGATEAAGSTATPAPIPVFSRRGRAAGA